MFCFYLLSQLPVNNLFNTVVYGRGAEVQVDADYKLKDMKKVYKDLEMKGKGYMKKLEDLQITVAKHMEQYGSVCRM